MKLVKKASQDFFDKLNIHRHYEPVDVFLLRPKVDNERETVIIEARWSCG